MVYSVVPCQKRITPFQKEDITCQSLEFSFFSLLEANLAIFEFEKFPCQGTKEVMIYHYVIHNHFIRCAILAENFDKKSVPVYQ